MIPKGFLSPEFMDFTGVFPFSNDRLTSLYDPAMRWLLRESVVKNRLVEQGNVEKGQRVLDLGCGTATLAIIIKKARPGADVIGIDGDRNILRIAEAKTRKQGLDACS